MLLEMFVWPSLIIEDLVLDILHLSIKFVTTPLMFVYVNIIVQ